MPNKEETLQLVDKEYQNLLEAIDGLDEEVLSRVWFGEWSTKQVIGHLLGWEREMTKALERLARGERPTPEGVDYSNTEEWNAKFAGATAAIEPRSIVAMWRQVHMTYVRAARAIPDERYGEGKTVNKLLQASTIGHYPEHAGPIRERRKQEGL